MAKLLSAPVVGFGALISSPALWSAFVEGTMPADMALGRLFVAVLVSWVGLSLVESLVNSTSPPRRTEEAPRALPPGDGPIPVRGVALAAPEEAVR